MATEGNTPTKQQTTEMLYRHGYQSEVIDRAWDKILAIERDGALRER